MKRIALIVVCLTVVSAGIIQNQDDQLKCEEVAKQILEAFQKQSKLFTNLGSKEFVFSPEESIRYTIDVNNMSFDGIQFASIDNVSECKQEGRYALSMNFKLNLGTPMLTAKVNLKERQEKQTSTKTLDVTAFAISEKIFQVQLNYNTQWKKVLLSYVKSLTPLQFMSFSDCRHDILFCEKLHQKLDSIAWTNVGSRISDDTEKVLPRLKL